MSEPRPISQELGSLLKFRFNVPCSRFEIIRRLFRYIKYHELEDPLNKRTILPNAALRGVLNLDEIEELLTYFNINKALRHHFPTDYRVWAAQIIQRSFKRYMKLQRVRRTIAAFRIQNAYMRVCLRPDGVGYHRAKRSFHSLANIEHATKRSIRRTSENDSADF